MTVLIPVPYWKTARPMPMSMDMRSFGDSRSDQRPRAPASAVLVCASSASTSSVFRILRRDRLPRQVSAGEVEYGRQHEGDDHENEQARQLARPARCSVPRRIQ